MTTTKKLLSTLWIFAVLNYLYCDVASLMDTDLLTGYLAGEVGGMQITPTFLLIAGVLMEIPIAMVLLSHVLPHRSNRIANIVAGSIMTAVQAGTLLMPATPYYWFFSIIEIATTVAVVVLAVRWTKIETTAEPVATEPEGSST